MKDFHNVFISTPFLPFIQIALRKNEKNKNETGK